ncbi:cysteine methyltransferase [Lysinibacillus sp. 2017]|uniref:cysteine methyltransferase n=1 Tax=unclassified Lysinibacillus TaxID=2636778 RepID=UPI000D52A72E|nr:MULTISPECIES: cysteine methyltransferase [unclassified Lysinibacillus]AWE08382.1 cysteine methyltransferase [Lysinibacillus sp. 2017]TGN35770.1 cysteine methyltransferase [Lysinibacillus sp. S2017]
MHNLDNKQTTLYLAADEQMQTHLTCKKLKDTNKEEFTFAIYAFCYFEQSEGMAKSVLLKLILGLNKTGLGMTLALELANIPNIFPMQVKQIVEHIQKSPSFLQVVTKQLNVLAATSDYDTSAQAKRAKQFFIENAPKGITAFSTNRQADQLIWLYQNEQLISNISPFTIDEKGGHISFSVRIGFKHSFIMQCYEVECMMHLFNEDEKIGYFFELYLDQENYHHQLLYNAMPDHFMENKAFLNQILQLMIKRNDEQYDEYLQDLIEKFTASI